MAKLHQRTKVRQNNIQLDARLGVYCSTLAPASHGARNFSRRTGNWPVYAAATGSALAMATGASASVINSGIVSAFYQSSVSVQAPGGSQSSIKGLLLGSGHEVNIKAISGTVGGTFADLELQPQGLVKILFTGNSSVRNFAFKSAIGGPDAAAHPLNVATLFSGLQYGQFLSGKPGFAGLSISTAGRANVEYGWLELVFTEENGIPYDLRALAFGIDTNLNQMIEAGQVDGGFIPEPGTMSLSILAAGAVGVAALRRRRKRAL